MSRVVARVGSVVKMGMSGLYHVVRERGEQRSYGRTYISWCGLGTTTPSLHDRGPSCLWCAARLAREAMDEDLI